MIIIIIRHVAGGERGGFQVQRVQKDDVKSTESVEIVSPVGFPVEGRSNSELMTDLRWYLERFLDFPFSPQTDIADRVQAALKGWGTQAFTALFGSGLGGQFFHDAVRDGLETLHLRISSDDPRVLGWPWEALHDPQSGFLAPTCQIERKLNNIHDPYPLSESLPKDRVNILLVTCRPFEADVRYRSLSRPLVEMVAKQKLPAEVTVLRPPTFDRLREHLLHERPDYYHIVHFDGHGAYQAEAVGPIDRSTFRGPIGKLAFEDIEGKPDLKDATQLAALLRECRIPAVVMNACQSGMIDHRTDDPFASVAAALLRSGVRSVVAMSYSLYVSGAKEFVPGFYRDLFRTGSIAQATRAGRQQMLARRGRICVRGRFDLNDWLVPVVYAQEAINLSFATQARTERPPDDADALPPEARDDENPYGFVGRDGPILELERAMHLPRAGILIQGLGGVGKTTLAGGFVRWLKDTGGLGRGCLWFPFQGIRAAEPLINQMAGALLGTDAISLPMEAKLDRLVAILKAERFLVVWDNFESVRGIPGTSVEANLSAEDQETLRTLLRRLRGGKSKVLITSRSTEEWLGDARLKVELGGLVGEERWEYCETILRDLGKSIYRDDPHLDALMELLAGHPLAMRVIVPRLETHTAAELVLVLRGNLVAVGPGVSELQDTLFATLRRAVETVPADLQPLCIPLALHEHYVDAIFLATMATQVDATWTRDRIDLFVSILSTAGLLRDRGQAIFEIHPVLTSFLRSKPQTLDESTRDSWSRAFALVLGWVADQAVSRPLHEQRGTFAVHSANFNHVRAEAERLEMDEIVLSLVTLMASYAKNSWNLTHTKKLWTQLAESGLAQRNEQLLAPVYGQLGMAAQRRGDLDAQGWYVKAFEIEERLVAEPGAASSYLQLGTVAQDRGDLDAAQRWYTKAIEIEARLGDESGAAITYHQLGIAAQRRGDLDAAQRWDTKALEIFERLGDEPGAASSYHQLGMVAQDRGDLDAAQRWYTKALKISERYGDEPGAASSYHQLGMVAQDRGDLDAAQRWYTKALKISERHGDEPGAASSYHQLGMVAQDRGDLDAAQRWYTKALKISERYGDEPGAASSYHQLGNVANLYGDLDAAQRWYTKALEIKERLGNEPGAATTYHHLGIVAQLRGDLDAAQRWYTKALEIEERRGDEPGAASSYGQLGMAAHLRGDLDAAHRWYTRALEIWIKTKNEQNKVKTQRLLDGLRGVPATG